MNSSHDVALAGRNLDYDEFLLGGPYMSWDGFLFFCHDFNVTPRRDGKGDRKMNTRAGEAFLLPDNADARIIFIMAALANHPLLKVKHGEDDDGDDQWAPGAREIWSDSTKIAGMSRDPKAGLSFSQFVDCICRIGLVGFASGTWAEMFPTSGEKVEAVFLTQMGLLDPALLSANLHNHQKSQGLCKAKFEGMSKLTNVNFGKDVKASDGDRNGGGKNQSGSPGRSPGRSPGSPSRRVRRSSFET